MARTDDPPGYELADRLALNTADQVGAVLTTFLRTNGVG
jgi:hypothetical protein